MNNQTITINNDTVGKNNQVYIIAEIGSNHNNNIEEAYKLIDIAKSSGCNAVKFQTYKAEGLYSKYTPRISEMNGRSKENETPFELIKRIEMDWEWHKTLFEYCNKKNITFISTPFDEDAVDVLESVNVPVYKVASYELTHLPLLRKIAKTGKPMILSTGNSNLQDIETALDTVYSEGNRNIIILHCVSQYPANYEDINLKAIKTLEYAFDQAIGFSDHTLDSVSAIGAVCFGAVLIEKHITLDKTHKGPDHPFSLEPDELVRFVKNIRAIESAIGTSIKKVNNSEQENHRLARRSIHAKVDIKKDTVITEDMICIKRPALGIKPIFQDIVLGRKAKSDIKEDEWITWDLI